ncbi:MAG: gliding motility-associated C-terminal domain-containing protein [Ferruginibacter sp.]|nr:gliding motility-associated C-terminal domain-containing protein [Ferruginibacter sp.]
MKKILLPIILFTVNFCFGQVNLNLGLKAYYPFSGNANDVSGNNNNPVFNNATLTADRFGNPNSAYHFDGASQYMKILNSATLNTTNKLSLVAWVKVQGFYAGTCHGNSIIAKGDADGLTGNYVLRFDDNAFTNGNNCSQAVDPAHQNFYGLGSSPNPPGYTPYIQTNQWYCVIATYDGTTARLYVNCELKVSRAQTLTTFTNSFDVFLGRHNSAAFPYWFNGDMDEVRIYDRALNIDEVNTLGGCIIQTPCNNWLNTPVPNSNARIGDLDISGNQLTIEASFNRTGAVNPVGGYGFLISKHTNSNDINYAMWPEGCSIRTTSGQFFAQENCSFQLNKTYHVAMVYDGVSLKYYRNGFLHSQTPAAGNLVLNDLITTIGQNVPEGASTIYPFIGNINEVRIWNVARSQAQLQTYMNNSLPNPTTIPGLLGYYTFDNLLNKQGNPAWNAALNGGASINATNPNCTFTADSCQAIAGSAIINAYTPVAGFNICDNKLTVEDATPFNVGDTVLLIQMKGAVIDSTNTTAFGSITDYKNAGNYEFNYVKSKTGNVIELKNTLTRQYDIPVGKVQLIRVPYFISLSTTDTLTCSPWDGSKGGVLAFNVQNTLTLNKPIDVSGKGFRGGINTNFLAGTLACNLLGYHYDNASTETAKKGEGIALIGTTKLNGRGKLANGAGGGNGHNAGGGGGSNASSGGFGGYQLDNCGGAPFDNRGIGGLALTYNNTLNKIFMGGGGGAGHYDGVSGSGHYSNGGNGGGIVIINANNMVSNGQAIYSKGNAGDDCIANGFPCGHEGMGGGGAGGSVILAINSFADNNIQNVNGGKGANLEVYTAAAGRVGPGGGGSGGVVWFKSASLPANNTVQNTGGVNGVIVPNASNPWGATAGSAGLNLFNLVIPVATNPFKPNIDSVRFNNVTACLNVNFNGLAYTNTNPINSWQWYFGDGGTSSTQNTSHLYASAGIYSVKLVVTDINGCKDSITKNITTGTFIADAGNDTAVCAAPTVSVTLHASAGATYSWTPAALLNNPAIQNPVATISATTKFYVTISDGSGCSATDSVTVTLTPALTPAVTISTPNNNICKGTPATFTAVAVNGGNSPSYQWQKNGNPAGTNSNTYTDQNLNNGDVIRCILTSSIACAAPATAQSNSIVMSIINSLANTRYPTLSAFPYQQLQLQARNIGNSYLWSPPVGLNNNTISNPVFYYSETQEYLVRINTSAGCIVVDTLLVEIKGKKGIYVPEGFTPNGDGNNDRLYPILVGIKKLNYFKVYNRWGNLLFETTSGRPEDGWDGTYKGKKQPVETYLWVVEGIDIDNITITKNGNTLLIR